MWDLILDSLEQGSLAISNFFDTLNDVFFTFFYPLRLVVAHYVNTAGDSPHPILSQLLALLTNNIFGDLSIFAIMMLNAVEIYVAITLVKILRD